MMAIYCMGCQSLFDDNKALEAENEKLQRVFADYIDALRDANSLLHEGFEEGDQNQYITSVRDWVQRTASLRQRKVVRKENVPKPKHLTHEDLAAADREADAWRESVSKGTKDLDDGSDR